MWYIMIKLWLLLVITTNTQSHKVVESTEDINPPQFNVTTLFPISNKTIYNTTIAKDEIEKMKEKEIDRDDDKIEHIKEINITRDEIKSHHMKQKEVSKVERNNQYTKENGIVGDESINLHAIGKGKYEATTWKLEAAFAKPNLEEKEKDCNVARDKEHVGDEINGSTKEFKPSQLLGSYLDDEVSISDTYGPFSPIIKKPDLEFLRFPKEEYRPIFSNIPKDIFVTHTEFPYKFESSIFTRAKDSWKPPDYLETRPTAEVPVKVPAGGLYKLADPFKDKPGVYVDDEDFNLAINGDVRMNHLEKRVNPWENWLRLITAFIPVGLIISALTPSVITVHPRPETPISSHLYRRSDTSIVDIAPISERCRRRLLCELHSDKNYQLHSSPPAAHPRNSKQCYKIYCEDTRVLRRLLHWLLTHHHPGIGTEDRRRFT